MKIELTNRNGIVRYNKTIIIEEEMEEIFISYLIERVCRYERDPNFRREVEDEYVEAMADLQGDADYHAMMEASGPPCYEESIIRRLKR